MSVQDKIVAITGILLLSLFLAGLGAYMATLKSSPENLVQGLRSIIIMMAAMAGLSIASAIPVAIGYCIGHLIRTP